MKRREPEWNVSHSCETASRPLWHGLPTVPTHWAAWLESDPSTKNHS